MRHPRTRAERREAKRKEFKRKLMISRTSGYPNPYYIAYARNKGQNYRNRTVDYDYHDAGQHRRFWMWLGEFQKEKIYFKTRHTSNRQQYFKKESNHAIRKNKKFSTRKSNDCHKVYEYAWTID